MIHLGDMVEDIESLLTAAGAPSGNNNNNNKDEFPVGMRVLAVDDDPVCLKLLEILLRRCQYDGMFNIDWLVLLF